jgi:uncharacterized paraquat-inducible protein A
MPLPVKCQTCSGTLFTLERLSRLIISNCIRCGHEVRYPLETAQPRLTETASSHTVYMIGSN